MTGERANLKIRKIFVLRTAVIGLIAGLLLGTFLALFLILISFFSSNTLESLDIDMGNLALDGAITLSPVIIFSSAIFGFFITLLGCLLYNFFSMIGLNIRFQIEDIGMKEEKSQSSAVQQPTIQQEPQQPLSQEPIQNPKNSFQQSNQQFPISSQSQKHL